MTARDAGALARWVDSLVGEPVVVVGSPPAEARDLDLLCSGTAARQLTGELAAAGFSDYAGTWVRFVGCSAEIVDVIEPGAFLAAGATERLLAAAQPLPGLRHVCVPAAHHQLLLLARRTAGERGELTARRRARLDRLATVPGVWEQAAAEADVWGSRRALDQLRRRWSGQPPGRIGRIRARLEGSRGRPLARRWASAAVPRRRRSPVIAFCGLDGAGKSTQADALAGTLELLGYAVVRRWSRLTYDPAVERVAAPAKRMLSLARRTAGLARGRGPDPSGRPGPTRSPAAAARRGPVAAAWTMTLVVLHSFGHRRARRNARGSVVIWDRYVADAVVQLRTDYGERTGTARPERLLRRLSPEPLVTFFLDVPAEVAAGRKDDYSADELERHRREYAAVARDGSMLVLDGTSPAPELCSRVAAAALRALTGTRR